LGQNLVRPGTSHMKWRKSLALHSRFLSLGAWPTLDAFDVVPRLVRWIWVH
jgi:hypothetical protein